MMTATRLLTAEEYAALPDGGRPTELVRGEVVPVNVPTPRHGQICLKIGRLIGNHADDHQLGHTVSNDSGVITERDPDTVRGADVAFYSFARIPPGRFPRGYPAVPPDLVLEVRSATDRWRNVHAKVHEYLEAGVNVVCVADEQTETLHVFPADGPPRQLAGDDELTLPDVLGDFRVPVRRFFE